MTKKALISLLLIFSVIHYLVVHGWQIVIYMPLAWMTPKHPKSQIVKWLKTYAIIQLLACDKYYNAMIGGHPDITISTRSYRRRHEWPFNLIIWVVEKVDPDHEFREITIEVDDVL